MKRLDLIIENIEYAKLVAEQYKDELLDEALAVARELRELKPVGVFEYDAENNVWEELTPNCEGVRLYNLGDEK